MIPTHLVQQRRSRRFRALLTCTKCLLGALGLLAVYYLSWLVVLGHGQ